ncbi:hypothetical protein OSB04_009086 [Centaurea solstitialis]|uniref:Hydroxyproline-rich glycoprotein family protein n=1 Tax=Centaurea solstitialis TaxID=347529 RepID=A0AA38U0Q6_9ASTR|nr:hypothetical protein OSB04_009086 [Centaurea solstitialis]
MVVVKRRVLKNQKGVRDSAIGGDTCRRRRTARGCAKEDRQLGMKSPLKKLRGLGLYQRRKRHQRHHDPQLDDLSKANQDMVDMKDCYDSLLSAAAATANSAYEFSESLREMGDCLLEKTSLNDDEDSGRVLLMLGKAQFEIQSLVDHYRAHIARTITVPSESLLNELRIVEEMKRQCDEKRSETIRILILHDEMKIRHKDRRRLGSGKGEYISSHQLREAQEEFDEDATLFVCRMKSLKGGQSRSLLTQAARHHAAQMCFFRKALKSLEAIEPHVKLVTEQQHIDYQFSGLEDDDRDSVFLTDDEDDEDESDDDHCMHQDGELSFEYQRNDQNNDVSSSENSMELESADLTFPQVASLNSVKRTHEMGKEDEAHCKRDAEAPLELIYLGYRAKRRQQISTTFCHDNSEATETFRQMRQSSARKLNTYVLPTPLEKIPKLDGQGPRPTTNMWHSSPLENKNILSKEKNSIVSNTQSAVLKESNNNSRPAVIPSPPLKEVRTSTQTDPRSCFNARDRHAFSSPLAGSVQPNKSLSSSSGPIGTTLQSSGSLSPTKLPSSSNSFVSSPKISELHELPRPPASKIPYKAGFSAPLVTFKGVSVTQIQSIPKESQNFRTSERIVSPPATPVSIKNRMLNFGLSFLWIQVKKDHSSSEKKVMRENTLSFIC